MLFPTYAITFLDIAVLLILALYSFSGFRNGFLLKVISCFSIAILCIIAWYISPYISSAISIFPTALTPMGGTIVEPAFYSLMNRLSVFAVLFIMFVVLTILVKPIIKAIGLVPIVNEVNRVLGIIFGFFQGLIIVGIVAFIFSTPLFANGNFIIQNSFLKPAYEVGHKVLFFMDDQIAKMNSIQKIVTPSSELSDTDINNIRTWLSNNYLEEKDIQIFIESLVRR